MIYEKNASVLAKMNSVSTGTKIMEDITEINVYPNPSQGKIAVRYSQWPEFGSKIEIVDISGRKITSRIISNKIEEFDLQNLTAGLYLVKSIIGSQEMTQKLIITK